MTSRERIEAALKHEEPDRTPMFEYVLQPPVAEQLLGRPYHAWGNHWRELLDNRGWEGAVRQMAADRLDLAELIGEDMIYVTPNAPPPSPSPPQERPAPPAADDALSRDPVAIITKRNEQRAAQPAAPPGESFLIYRALKDEMARRGIDLPILAPAYAHGVWTDTDLMMTMSLAPEVAHRHFELCTRSCLALVEKFIELGIDQAGVGGDFAGNRPVISPAAYREFIMPEVRKVSRRAHEAGLWTVNASDGDLWPVIDDFLTGCEVDGYLEIDLHAGMDLARLKAAHGGRITFYGNLDCGNTLSFGSPDDVRHHVIGCIDAGMGGGGHILCSSNAITESVPVENYVAVINAHREVFGLTKFSL